MSRTEAETACPTAGKTFARSRTTAQATGGWSGMPKSAAAAGACWMIGGHEF